MKQVLIHTFVATLHQFDNPIYLHTKVYMPLVYLRLITSQFSFCKSFMPLLYLSIVFQHAWLSTCIPILKLCALSFYTTHSIVVFPLRVFFFNAFFNFCQLFALQNLPFCLLQLALLLTLPYKTSYYQFHGLV